MDINIISISNTIDNISYRLKTTIGSLGRIFDLDYGDYGRVPEEYLNTNTTSKPFVGFLPNNKTLIDKKHYQNFPKISQQLLRELFSNIGVKYVPEVTLFKLNTRTPFEAFEQFCLTFTRKSPRVDVYELNRVILKLKEMDGYRTKYPLNSRPIYHQLSLMRIDKADSLIVIIKEVVSFLDELDSSQNKIFEEAKEELIQNWYLPNSLNSFKTKHNLL